MSEYFGGAHLGLQRIREIKGAADLAALVLRGCRAYSKTRTTFGRHCAAFGRQERECAKTGSSIAAHSAAKQSFRWQGMRVFMNDKFLSTIKLTTYFCLQLNCDELSKTLEQEEAKLQELQTQLASSSGRGHAQRFELWTALESDIKAAIKRILKNDEMENEDGQYIFFFFVI